MNFVNISEQKRKLARRAAWHLVRDKCSGVDVAMRYLDVTQGVRYKMEDIARWQGDMDSRGTQEQYPTSKRPLAHKWICREFATRWQNPYLLLFQWFLLPEYTNNKESSRVEKILALASALANRWLFSSSFLICLTQNVSKQFRVIDKYKRENLPQNSWRNLLQNVRIGAWSSSIN